MDFMKIFMDQSYDRFLQESVEPLAPTEAGSLDYLMDEAKLGNIKADGNFALSRRWQRLNAGDFMRNSFLLTGWAEFFSEYTAVSPMRISHIFSAMSIEQVEKLFENIETVIENCYSFDFEGFPEVDKTMELFINKSDESTLLKFPRIFTSYLYSMSRRNWYRIPEAEQKAVKRLEEVFLVDYIKNPTKDKENIVTNVLAKMVIRSKEDVVAYMAALPNLLTKNGAPDWRIFDLYQHAIEGVHSLPELHHMEKPLCINMVATLQNSYLIASYGSRIQKYLQDAEVKVSDILDALS